MADESHSQPREIGGYAPARILAPGRSWLAVAPGDRAVVLKVLDEDCLWNNALHPSIRDRLARVRELAHTGVANLYGVERARGMVYAVWDYVPGRTFDDFALAPGRGRTEVMALARELMLALEVLHARGIVHGAVKPANVIVSEDGARITLTHISPWLYTEAGEDIRAAIGMLLDITGRRGESDTPEGVFLGEATGHDLTARQLAARLATFARPQDSGRSGGADAAWAGDARQADPVRRRALAGAALTTVAGVAIFAGLKLYAARRQPSPPPPPEAPAAALQPPDRPPIE